MEKTYYDESGKEICKELNKKEIAKIKHSLDYMIKKNKLMIFIRNGHITILGFCKNVYQQRMNLYHHDNLYVLKCELVKDGIYYYFQQVKNESLNFVLKHARKFMKNAENLI